LPLWYLQTLLSLKCVFMYLCVMGIDFAYFYNVSIGLWNRPGSVVCFFPILILINSVYSFYFNMEFKLYIYWR
jgi:hypothetical protein